MSVCQYNTIRFYLKQNQKTHQKQYWPAKNVSWTTFYVRPLICSIIVPTESTSPPQAKRGTEVIYLDIYIWFIKYFCTFALLLFAFTILQVLHTSCMWEVPHHTSPNTLFSTKHHIHINYVDIFYMRSHPEKQHLAWLLVTFLGDFSCLSWAPITYN